MTLTIGQQLKNDGWKITYIRNARNISSGEAVFTVLSRVVPKSQSGLKLEYEYKYSICNPKDNFSRKMGLVVAYSKPSKVLNVQSEQTVLSEIILDLTQEKLSPDAVLTLQIYSFNKLIYLLGKKFQLDDPTEPKSTKPNLTIVK